jgi:hypothetical protein
MFTVFADSTVTGWDVTTVLASVGEPSRHLSKWDDGGRRIAWVFLVLRWWPFKGVNTAGVCAHLGCWRWTVLLPSFVVCTCPGFLAGRLPFAGSRRAVRVSPSAGVGGASGGLGLGLCQSRPPSHPQSRSKLCPALRSAMTDTLTETTPVGIS